jgi:single-stranded DNA-binding protein
MTIHALVAGSLAHDPQQRSGSIAAFTTGTIRTTNHEFMFIIAFGAEGGRLLEHSKGDAVAVSGRAKVTSWSGHDGLEKHGLDVVVDQLASGKPRATRRAKPYPKSRTRPTYCDEGTLRSDRVDDLFVEGAE